MIKNIIEKEKITLFKLFNLVFMFKLLYRYKYIQFFLTGISGVLINTLVSFIFVTFIFTVGLFGFKNTTVGIFMGNTINLFYNFVLHTLVTFKTKKDHSKRFLFFILYSLFMTYIIIVPLSVFLTSFFENVFFDFGWLIVKEYIYLIVTAVVILFFSVFNFLLFKIWMFKEK